MPIIELHPNRTKITRQRYPIINNAKTRAVLNFGLPCWVLMQIKFSSYAKTWISSSSTSQYLCKPYNSKRHYSFISTYNLSTSTIHCWIQLQSVSIYNHDRHFSETHPPQSCICCPRRISNYCSLISFQIIRNSRPNAYEMNFLET